MSDARCLEDQADAVLNIAARLAEGIRSCGFHGPSCESTVSQVPPAL